MALVWVVIFAILVFFFWIAQFDTEWMRDNLRFIAEGLQYTLYIALGGIVLLVVLALLGALARISSNPIAYGISGFYVSFFRGTPLIVRGDEPSTIESGVYLPLSSAAAAVTTLNVEPGG